MSDEALDDLKWQLAVSYLIREDIAGLRGWARWHMWWPLWRGHGRLRARLTAGVGRQHGWLRDEWRRYCRRRNRCIVAAQLCGYVALFAGIYRLIFDVWPL